MATAGIVKSLSEQRRKIHYQFQHGKSPRCCLVICRYTVTAVCRTSPTTNCSKRQNGRVILKCHFPLGFFLVSLTTTIIPGTTRQYTSDYRNIDMNLLTGKPTHKRQRVWIPPHLMTRWRCISAINTRSGNQKKPSPNREGLSIQ